MFPIHQFIHVVKSQPYSPTALADQPKCFHCLTFVLAVPLLPLAWQALGVLLVIALCVCYCLYSRFCSSTADPLQAALNDAINKDGPCVCFPYMNWNGVQSR
eukprot:COSAG02_NODE_4728_length_5045_cov_9.058835_6_plen_102_part_00